MKFLVPNYSYLQNHWLRGYSPQIPVFSVLCPQLNLLNPPPPEKNSWVRHCTVTLPFILPHLPSTSFFLCSSFTFPSHTASSFSHWQKLFPIAAGSHWFACNLILWLPSIYHVPFFSLCLAFLTQDGGTSFLQTWVPIYHTTWHNVVRQNFSLWWCLCFSTSFTLILLTWRIWWAPKNASKGQMGFNTASKGLRVQHYC